MDSRGDPWQPHDTAPRRARHSPGGPAVGDTGTVYLIHLDKPYKHARHYLGWTNNLDARLEAHQAGHGARLMEVVKAAGITWRLARTWPGSRDRERAIKNRHEAPRLCLECSPVPPPVNACRSAGQADPGRQAAAAPPPPPRHEPPLRAVAADLIGDPWRQASPSGPDLGDIEMEAG
jgi:predicted GIY-YIG superfamily endonuclease